MEAQSTEVLVVGARPTGLTLAAELALAGISVAVIEKRPGPAFAGSRAGGLHARTLEVFDQRGVVDRFLAEGQKAQIAAFAGSVLDISRFPTRHNYGLGLWQSNIERLLATWVGELGVPITYGAEVTGFEQDDTGVDVMLSAGSALRTQYLVGCDGGRSVVRRIAGIPFSGSEPTISNLIAEVEMTEMPEWGVHRSPAGLHSFGRRDYQIVDGEIIYADQGPVRVMVTEQHVGSGSEPDLNDLRVALVAACGTATDVIAPSGSPDSPMLRGKPKPIASVGF